MIKINRVTCNKCNDILYSFHRHDYKRCSCGQSGIDGGFDYTRIIGHPLVESLPISDAIYTIRDSFIWTRTKDKQGNILPNTEYILLNKMATDYILSIIQYKLAPYYNLPETHKGDQIDKTTLALIDIFLEELKYRNIIKK